jgi:hypothetical protein
MSLFIAVLDELSKRLDKCVSLPESSIRRIKAEIKALDNEHKRRIIRVLAK